MYRAARALVESSLERGDSPEAIRSALLTAARRASCLFDSYTHETVVAAIQRAIDDGLAHEASAAQMTDGEPF
jgi:hypothetical protein